MQGFKRPLLPPGPLDDLVAALHALHLAAGYPSTRQLQRDIGGPGVISHTSVHNLFTSGRCPGWGPVELVVEAMARHAGVGEKAEIERFRGLWVRAAHAGSTAIVDEGTFSIRAGMSGSDTQESSEQLSRPVSELLPGALSEIEAAGAGGGNYWQVGMTHRIPIGFSDLDALLGGWTPGNLIIIGGRSSSGKTMLLLNFCRTTAIRFALPSMLVSGELSSTEVQLRLLSAEARVPHNTIMAGQMNEDDQARLARVVPTIANAPLHIATPSTFHIGEVKAETVRLVQESGLKVLFVDGLQWITANAGPAHASTVESSLQELKDLAVRLRVPVIVSAPAEKILEDFPGSGAIQYLRDIE